VESHYVHTSSSSIKASLRSLASYIANFDVANMQNPGSTSKRMNKAQAQRLTELLNFLGPSEIAASVPFKSTNLPWHRCEVRNGSQSRIATSKCRESGQRGEMEACGRVSCPSTSSRLPRNRLNLFSSSLLPLPVPCSSLLLQRFVASLSISSPVFNTFLACSLSYLLLTYAEHQKIDWKRHKLLCFKPSW